MISKNIKISIVTPTYNSEKTIERTMNSILKQDYQNIEYVIVDGNSRDNTLQIINNYKDKFDDRGICFRMISEADKGISDAFNKGVKLCTGDIIGIINSDDWLEDNTLQIISDNYTENHSIYCGHLNLYNNSEFIKTRKSRPSFLWLGMYIMHPTVFVKKEVYSRFNFDENLKISMDLDFMLKATRIGKYKIKNIPLLLSNMELGGVSSDKNKMKIEEMKVLKKYSSIFQYACIKTIKKIESILSN